MTKPTKPIKIRFFEFVLLHQGEYDKLKEKFGDRELSEKMGNLNDYIGAMGYQQKYKSHYHVILMWAKKEGKKFKHVPEKPVQQRKAVVDSPEVLEKREVYRRLCLDHRSINAPLEIDRQAFQERILKAEIELYNAVENMTTRKLGTLIKKGRAE